MKKFIEKVKIFFSGLFPKKVEEIKHAVPCGKLGSKPLKKKKGATITIKRRGKK